MEHGRRHYRSAPEPWWDLQIDVVEPSGKIFAADVVDISGGGVKVAFDTDTAPPVELGMAVTIRLTFNESDDAIDTAVVAVRVEKDGDRLVLGLQFLDWMGLVESVPKNMAQLFNLRADPRLPLDPATPIELRIRGFENEFSLEGVLLDLSRSGLSFSTKLLSQCVLNRVDYCMVDFDLPELVQSFSFGAGIRYRCLSGESLRYGVWFDPTVTERFTLQQSAIGSYVLDRIKASLVPFGF